VPELSFEIVEGPDAGRVVPVGGSLVIGSGEGVEVVLADPRVERRHTRITAAGDGVLVEDLGEPGGTFVNDAELRAPTRMSPGDELQVGVTVLKLRAGADAPSEVRPRPPALASAQVEPGYLVPGAADAAPAPARRASDIDDLLDVRTKRMARHAPLAVFVIVVWAVLIYLLTAKL
jgi:type III secretion system (T3SS) inner membrane Yop/YscD-like protein